jgi:predicted 2-oxoglutarate/Fe(II)-dependent dioxygenase YbiX
VPYYSEYTSAFDPTYLSELQGQILACPHFTVNNLNRDFVKTKGFSIAFQRSQIEQVERIFPYFKPYLDRTLQADCNAFYLNPLLLQSGSRVDPHIDRSLRSYCKTIDPPLLVSVLYVEVPKDIQGGELILANRNRSVARIRPHTNTLILFQGDLTHSINPVTCSGIRLSLVCEQYRLDSEELREIPEIQIESRTLKPEKKKKKDKLVTVQ